MKYLLLLFLTSCSTTYVTVDKKIYVIGIGNTIDQGGSNLKDNTLDQKSDGELVLPVK